MKLYTQENIDIIRRMQNEDPFFAYLTRKVFSLVGDRPKGTMLDLGCGSGRNAFYFAKKGYQCVGIDIEPKVIAIATMQAKREHLQANVSFFRKDIMRLQPRELGMYDVVILSEVIEHIVDYQKAVHVAFSHVKKGGVLVITTPHDPRQWNQLDTYAEHVQRFSKETILRLLMPLGKTHLETAGFPFHRSVIAAYHYLCMVRKQSHRAISFRRNRFTAWSYFLIGSFLLQYDNFFNSLGLGTTIIATVKK